MAGDSAIDEVSLQLRDEASKREDALEREAGRLGGGLNEVRVEKVENVWSFFFFFK